MRSVLLALCLFLALPLPASEALAPHTGEIIVAYHDEGLQLADTGRHQVHGAERLRDLPMPATEIVRPAPEEHFEAVLARYRNDPDVRYAEPNYIVETQAPLPSGELVDAQWWVCIEQNSGQCLDDTGTGATLLPAAWQAWRDATGAGNPIGSSDVLVAIIDTGIRATHRDLQGNVLVELGCEIRGTNTNFDPSANCPSSRRDFEDRNGHGTHIAGIIGAVTDASDSVVAGFNWRVGLLPLKALEDVGRGNVVDTSNAILYAMARAEGRPLVINASYGYRPPNGQPSTYELEILQRAREQNVLVVAAAGNDGGDNDDGTPRFFPASHRLTNVIGVAASLRDGSRAAYSRFGGNTVLLAAPGGSTQSNGGAIISTYIDQDDDNALIDGWAGLSGTSMAAPMVVGAAALRLSLTPDLDVKSLREILVSSATRDARWDGVVLAGGRLDTAAAITADQTSLDPMPASHVVALPRNNGSRVEVAWLDNSNRNDGYVVQRRETAGDWETVSPVLPADAGSFMDTAIDDLREARYDYRIAALGGSSDECCLSAVVSLGTAPPVRMDRIASSSSSSPCFIATAAYGTPMAEEIQALRAFRDDVLQQHRLGRWFIHGYESLSPPVAAVIAERPRLRALTRLLLRPVVGAARLWQR
ncbi:subtilisin family serine protease [Natronocella acetinitrilica]|uniref:Subtilisin family serine protease n=1 Tax=Natronocella acetinitrilica TaxID=414046 RepID=A0AAE3G262_9GAMM|nr:S8 family serine peptidase [Natronocella acetinitrilica]MCP1673778.1 subtilisin family serine protease [Natronocella acetinitrilica]